MLGWWGRRSKQIKVGFKIARRKCYNVTVLTKISSSLCQKNYLTSPHKRLGGKKRFEKTSPTLTNCFVQKSAWFPSLIALLSHRVKIPDIKCTAKDIRRNCAATQDVLWSNECSAEHDDYSDPCVTSETNLRWKGGKEDYPQGSFYFIFRFNSANPRSWIQTKETFRDGIHVELAGRSRR